MEKVQYKKSDFYYDLPEELIAQTPVYPRDSSRLLVYHRNTNTIEHKVFHDVIDYLNPGDALVVNETRVIPARLLGEKEDTGVPVEVLLLKRVDKDSWETLVRPGKRARVGSSFTFGGILRATVEDIEIFAAHIQAPVQIKAAGGISDLKDAEEFLRLGANRLGTSRIVKIVKSQESC
mgnify:CR=1 FL=1